MRFSRTPRPTPKKSSTENAQSEVQPVPLKYATLGTTSVSERHVNSVVRFPLPSAEFPVSRIEVNSWIGHRGPTWMVPGEAIEPSQGFGPAGPADIHHVAITK